MRGPFTRRCDIHSNEEIASSISTTGHETLWCPQGHRIRQWYVTDADGVKVAMAHLHSAPQILDTDLLLKLSIDPLFNKIPPPPPTNACKYGHKDWYLSRGRYECRPCKQDYYLKNKTRLAKQYKEKRAKLLAERGNVPVKRKRRKKNV